MSITGGYVYHGRKHPLLAGKYVYGDYVTGKIWGLGYNKQINWQRELLDTPLRIICFGTDADGADSGGRWTGDMKGAQARPMAARATA